MSGTKAPQQDLRIACVQYEMRKPPSEDAFHAQLEEFIAMAAQQKCGFIVFPELFTCALLSTSDRILDAKEAVEFLTDYTPRYKIFLKHMAQTHSINIIGGSILTRRDNGNVRNVCYIALRNGELYEQEKIHPTPSEREGWGVTGGDDLRVFETEYGSIGVLICYDTEFPEAGRRLSDQGAQIIFVPFCSDDRAGYWRVRYCASAIAVMHQTYVAMSGTMGNIQAVHNLDESYAESCILTPCDSTVFPQTDGVATIAKPQQEALIFADISLEKLLQARESGTVQNLKDRRFDLYKIQWKN